MKVKVITKNEYTRKKDGVTKWRVTALDEEGRVVCFFRPLEEQPKQGDEYETVLIHDNFKFSYYVSFEKC